MILELAPDTPKFRSVSRVCGGDPIRQQPDDSACMVFPAYAGVIPDAADAASASICVSRVCGGDPRLVCFMSCSSACFPRRWTDFMPKVTSMQKNQINRVIMVI